MERESTEDEMDVRLEAALKVYAEGGRGRPVEQVFQKIREKFKLTTPPSTVS
jgi:hypothetical protein